MMNTQPRRLSVLSRVAMPVQISVRKVGPRSVAGLGALSTALVQAKKLGCKQGAEYTSKGWQCREKNPAMKKLARYTSALAKKAAEKKRLSKLSSTMQRAAKLASEKRAKEKRLSKLSPTLQRAAKLASAKRQETPAAATVSVSTAPALSPATDAQVVLDNEQSLVTTETETEEGEGGLGLGALLAGAAAVAAVGGIAYLLLRKKGGSPAPATRRSSAKRSTRRSTAPISSARSTLRSGTAVIPNKYGSTKVGRWRLYSDESGNYLLTTKSHASGSVPITIDDVTGGSAKRLGQLTALWPRSEDGAENLVRQVLVRANASRSGPIGLELSRFFYKRGLAVRKQRGYRPEAAYSAWRQALEDGRDLLAEFRRVRKTTAAKAKKEAKNFFEDGLFPPQRRKAKRPHRSK